MLEKEFEQLFFVFLILLMLMDRLSDFDRTSERYEPEDGFVIFDLIDGGGVKGVCLLGVALGIAMGVVVLEGRAANHDLSRDNDLSVIVLNDPITRAFIRSKVMANKREVLIKKRRRGFYV